MLLRAMTRRPRLPAATLRRMAPRHLSPEKLAGRKTVWLGHAVIWATGVVTVTIAAGPFVGAIVASGWGIGLATHGFFAVAAPQLRIKLATPQPVLAATNTADSSRFAEELAASIAHEIRNPITAARSLVQQIGEDPGGEDTAEYARVATEELDRVERSITHLLRYAREPEVEPRAVALGEIVRSGLSTLAERAVSNGVQIDITIDESVRAYADAEHVRQSVINLCSNALDAVITADTLGPRLEIDVGRNLAQTQAWLRVRDNGPGMKPEVLARVFQPFFTSKKSGTGLGLAISRRLARAQRGDLEARSVPGDGAELLLTLPTAPRTLASQSG
mgnify:CR=1 FL=1